MVGVEQGKVEEGLELEGASRTMEGKAEVRHIDKEQESNGRHSIVEYRRAREQGTAVRKREIVGNKEAWRKRPKTT